jgi:hypothetical protein
MLMELVVLPGQCWRAALPAMCCCSTRYGIGMRFSRQGDTSGCGAIADQTGVLLLMQGPPDAINEGCRRQRLRATWPSENCASRPAQDLATASVGITDLSVGMAAGLACCRQHRLLHGRAGFHGFVAPLTPARRGAIDWPVVVLLARFPWRCRADHRHGPDCARCWRERRTRAALSSATALILVVTCFCPTTDEQCRDCRRDVYLIALGWLPALA